MIKRTLYFGFWVAETNVLFAGANNKEENKSPSKLGGRATFTSEGFMIYGQLYEFHDCLTSAAESSCRIT